MLAPKSRSKCFFLHFCHFFLVFSIKDDENEEKYLKNNVCYSTVFFKALLIDLRVIESAPTYHKKQNWVPPLGVVQILEINSQLLKTHFYNHFLSVFTFPVKRRKIILKCWKKYLSTSNGVFPYYLGESRIFDKRNFLYQTPNSKNLCHHPANSIIPVLYILNLHYLTEQRSSLMQNNI